ncbi:hypothetical protein BMS3Abin14_00111 [bacterium BMS3Abin14]|nr:hypothetical protein BMS3Abin14_00111 [bacterium BMS3Abin14]
MPTVISEVALRRRQLAMTSFWFQRFKKDYYENSFAGKIYE